MASPALRWLRAAAALAIATSFGAAALPGTAGAIDTGPRAFYASAVGGPGVQVGGTFTPVVGNFAGDDADDVFEGARLLAGYPQFYELKRTRERPPVFT